MRRPISGSARTSRIPAARARGSAGLTRRPVSPNTWTSEYPEYDLNLGAEERQLEFFPAPDGNYTVRVTYRKTPPSAANDAAILDLMGRERLVMLKLAKDYCVIQKEDPAWIDEQIKDEMAAIEMMTEPKDEAGPAHIADVRSAQLLGSRTFFRH